MDHNCDERNRTRTFISILFVCWRLVCICWFERNKATNIHIRGGCLFWVGFWLNGTVRHVHKKNLDCFRLCCAAVYDVHVQCVCVWIEKEKMEEFKDTTVVQIKSNCCVTRVILRSRHKQQTHAQNTMQRTGFEGVVCPFPKLLLSLTRTQN